MRQRKTVDCSNMPVMLNKCPTCPFGENGCQKVRANVEQRCLTVASQTCHEADDKRLCRGARDYQIQFFYRLRILDEPTDAAWQRAADRLEMRRGFHVRRRYISFDVPKNLETVSANLFQRERERAEKDWQESLAEIRLLLREQLADLVKHLVERLEPNPDGTKKRFHDSTISNITEWVNNLSIRNIANDTELKSLSSRVKELLNGTGAEEVKSNEALRDSLKQSMTLVKTQLDGLVHTATRRIKVA